jgi:hypothetical protein
VNKSPEYLGSEVHLTGLVSAPSKSAEKMIKEMRKAKDVCVSFDDPASTKLPSVYHVEVKPGVVIDIYAITNAYQTSHEIHHAIKKLAVAGKRKGGKDQRQDLREAINQIELEIKRLDLWEGKQ